MVILILQSLKFIKNRFNKLTSSQRSQFLLNYSWNNYRLRAMVIAAFLSLVALTWFDEIFDLPHLIFGHKISELNWPEAIIETVVIVIVGGLLLMRLTFILYKLKSAEAELNKFRLAVEKASDHIVITDPEGMIVYANQAVEKITGYSPKEIVGKKAGGRELWGGLMGKEVYRNLWRTIKEKKEPFIGEFRNRRKDGTEYDAEGHIYPILDDRGRIIYFAGLEIDISELKRLEQAKSEFVSLASHQLRTPLTSISLSLDLLLRGSDGELNEGQTRALKEIYQDIASTSELVQALLNLSRIDMGTFKAEPEILSPKTIAEEVITAVGPQMDNKAQILQRDYDESLSPVSMDRNVLRIILQNLISNAVKYTSTGGRIKVGLKLRSNNLLIEVADTGIGIPRAEQDKMFTKFFRAHNTAGLNVDGTGIGLNLTKTIIEATGGRIWFESEEGRGTTFFVKIPVGLIDNGR